MYVKQVLRMLMTLGFSVYFFIGCSEDNNFRAAVEDEVPEAALPTDEVSRDSPGEVEVVEVEPQFDTSLQEVQAESRIVEAKKEHETFKFNQEQEKESLLPQLEQKQETLKQANKKYESKKQTYNDFSERFEVVSQKYASLTEIQDFNISDMDLFMANGENQFHQFFSGLQNHYQNLIQDQTSAPEDKNIQATIPNADDITRLAESGLQQMKDELKELEDQFFMNFNQQLKRIGINLYKESEERIAELKEEIARVEALQSIEPQVVFENQEDLQNQTDTERAQYIEELKTLISNIEMASDREKALNVYLINNPPQYSLKKLTTSNAWKGDGPSFDFELNVSRMFSLYSVEYLSGKHEIVSKIAMAYEQLQQDQESVEELANELQAEVQELVQTYELNTNTDSLEEAVAQMAEYKQSLSEELSEKESSVTQQQTEIEAIQTQVANIEASIQGSLEAVQQFEQKVYASPEYKKIALSQKIQETGLDANFADVIHFLVDKNLSKISLEEEKIESLTKALETLAEQSTDTPLEQFKLHYENILLEEFLSQEDLHYNQQATNLFDPFLEGRIQELSGTLLFHTLKWKADQSLESMVIILTQGHILPGFLTQQEDGTYTLTGVESTAPGFALKHFGPTSEVMGDIRVFDAKWAITVHLLGDQISNLPQVVDDMQSQMEAYGFQRENLLAVEPNFLLDPTDEEIKVDHFFPFAFGTNAKKPGDLPRDSFDPVDVNQYTKLKELATAE